MIGGTSLAKNYIDNLKEETGKGLREKAEQGQFPSKAPIGYRNNRETKLIEVDHETAPLVRRLYELYAACNLSLEMVKDQIAKEGYRAKNGRKLHKAEVDFILKNPIYYGYFRWRGVLYKGVHQPIISKDLFDGAQGHARRFNKPRKVRHNFAYAGMMTCGTCGFGITAEIKKGKYIYYHCTHYKGDCGNGSIRQEELEGQFGEVIRSIHIDEQRLEWFKRALVESHGTAKEEQENRIAALTKEHQQLQAWLDIAYQDRLRGVIDEAHWLDASMKWKNRQATILDALQRGQGANHGYLDTGVRILELAHRAYGLFQVRNSHEKRALLDTVLSNCTLAGKKITPTYRRPFDVLVEGSARLDWLPD